MKVKNLTEEQAEQIAGIIDNEGFWYALNDGGYLKPEDVLENEQDIKKVKEAIETIAEFENICPN